MGDWKSSAIGGSDAEVMKSGVSKCTCLRSYRGVQKNRSYQSDIYMVCFYVILCGVREQGCFAHRVFIRKVITSYDNFSYHKQIIILSHDLF